VSDTYCQDTAREWSASIAGSLGGWFGGWGSWLSPLSPAGRRDSVSTRRHPGSCLVAWAWPGVSPITSVSPFRTLPPPPPRRPRPPRPPRRCAQAPLRPSARPEELRAGTRRPNRRSAHLGTVPGEWVALLPEFAPSSHWNCGRVRGAKSWRSRLSCGFSRGVPRALLTGQTTGRDRLGLGAPPPCYRTQPARELATGVDAPRSR
jgi:hypothetical protein